MHRFFIPPHNISSDGMVRFPKDTARQLVKVLRMDSGSEVVILDNQGNQYHVILSVLDEKEVTGRVIESGKAVGEPKHKLTIYIALTQRQKFEWIIQKSTEVGAAAFIPVITERSLVQVSDYSEQKVVRWRRIIQEAAEQSCRGLIPALSLPMRFTTALDVARQAALPRFILCQDERSMGVMEATQVVMSVASKPGAASVMVGPEGGFTREEVNMACVSGFQPVSLGKRTLRMETAATVATALILYELGDLKPG